MLDDVDEIPDQLLGGYRLLDLPVQAVAAPEVLQAGSTIVSSAGNISLLEFLTNSIANTLNGRPRIFSR